MQLRAQTVWCRQCINKNGFSSRVLTDNASLAAMLQSTSMEVYPMPRKYGKAAQKSVKRAMHKRKHGTLKSGKKGTTRVKSRKQAIAIGLSEARKKGAKVPRKK